ncbi:ABC transporter substrate-binding protein [Roseicitreum antarcticum]|uniref:Iron(III) transport system substrate-binding protein n=1 Tax=Roseicitreum antarcticum TaxID=564137 RepID=A0A1H2Z4Y8_9RHOB|nr:ABC transporter substrate-binding protein [Roseicitreum antarcticum]SDX12492.1 iron(III) transport system substrate-binding protein [Roseicitreum antarcticum]
MKHLWIAGTTALLLAGSASAQTPPAGYPADYADLIAAARTEGSLLIYTNLSNDNLGPVIDAFKEVYPDIDVQSVEMGPSEAFSRYAAETGTGVASADLVVANSIPDWVRAVEGGTLDPYTSPEQANLPGWSYPEPGLYTFSTDPMVTIYNKLTVPADLQVASMEAYFANITAHPDVFEGKVGTYDGRYAFGGSIGYAFAAHHGDAAWEWFAAAGPMTRPGGGAGGMIERTLTGELASSFFVSAPVVLSRLDPALEQVLGWTFPSDGTPVFLRGMGIMAEAQNKAAARVFLDFVLSEPGQYAVAAGNLTPYRPGVAPEAPNVYSLDEVIAAIGDAEKLIMIDYDSDMVANFEAFTTRWGAAFNM